METPKKKSTEKIRKDIRKIHEGFLQPSKNSYCNGRTSCRDLCCRIM